MYTSTRGPHQMVNTETKSTWQSGPDLRGLFKTQGLIEAKVAIDWPCIAHGPPAKTPHRANIGTGGKAEQGATEGNMEENSRE